jgi:hypothetical protein
MLPSKRVLSVFILAAALVAAIIIAFGRDKASSAINYASNLVIGEKISIPENPNWQNELGRVGVDATLIQTEESTTTPETTTDIVSKTLMTNYLALKQSGKLDQESAQKLIDQTVDYLNKTDNQVIRTTQLNIIVDNGKKSVTDYGENLGNILKKNRPKEIIDEREIISAAVNSRDISKINELDAVIAVYEKIADELIKMPVPQTFVKAHLDLVNGAKGMALALTEIKAVFSDPVKGLQAMQLYTDGVTIFTQAIKATVVFISQNNIVYKQDSGGYYLLYGI